MKCYETRTGGRRLASLTDHPDIPIGTATLRWVVGQGYVSCPHLFQVTLVGSPAEAETYLVQTFLGRRKAEAIVLSAHNALRRWPVVETHIEELGPSEPGGTPDALDDQAEW